MNIRRQSIGKQNNQRIQNHYIHQQLSTFMQMWKKSIICNTQIPILTTFGQIFNQSTLRYQLNAQKCSKFQLNTNNLCQATRILQLVNICRKNLQKGKKITKRSLYYHLCSYYNEYRVINYDISLICSNLSLLSGQVITRDMLGIVASARGLVYGKIQLWADGESISMCQNSPGLIVLPTCSNIEVRKVPSKTKVLLVEKQSVFYEIISNLKRVNIDNRYDEYIVITAKGYPDWITRKLLNSLEYCPQISNIFYCGDYDVFGFDIFLFYCFGDWTCPGIHNTIKLLDFNCKNNLIFDYSMLIFAMFDQKDTQKVKDIHNREYFKLVRKDQMMQHTKKIRQFYSQFCKFANQGKKCQTQQFIRAAMTPVWFDQLISQQNYG